MRAYLAGSIEFSDDGGKDWRRRLRTFLVNELGHEVYDPSDDGKKNLNEEEAANFRQWKTTNFERYCAAVRKIINFDLDIIENRIDYVVCHWEEHSSRGGGTAAELTAAFRRGLPVYVVTEVPLGSISGWVLSCADKVFTSFGGLKSFLIAEWSRPSKIKSASANSSF
jgi:hypothetical protein